MQKLTFLNNRVARQWADARSDWKFHREMAAKYPKTWDIKAMALEEKLKEEGPQLPAFAWPGGYPLVYFDAGGNLLCSKCATTAIKDAEKDNRPRELQIHYEGAPATCQDCMAEIESAYGFVEDVSA